MSKKSKKPSNVEETPLVIEKINDESLESIMGDRYASYAKYVIQERAIPDVRDGLKPVQRRIIYAMQKAGLTYNNKRAKCARIVGDVMGHYHPHGDSSIYEAVVRMAQDWKSSHVLIDFQGNKGSIDGDEAAAMRYTEARLSAISEEMVRDYEKDTVDMILTYDDKTYEPTVLPARFPNLLVNGSEGIAVAIATDIPTHNLNEVIDAIIHRITHVNCSPEDLLEFIKGPDFPTGGIIYKSKGLEDIYLTGRGKIEIAGTTEIVQKKDINQIIISEIPYKVLKIQLVHEIDLVRYNKEINGIIEVRDESDRTSYRIAIDLKKEAKADVILQYLMNKTSLKTTYSANMVAIVNGHPKTMTILDFIDAYIAHEQEILTRRSNYLLAINKKRLHVVDGLIKAISILDEVVATIRASKDKGDAKTNLENKFGFTPEQSEAIVTLQLYRLTNTDITTLTDEKASLESENEYLQGLLDDEKKLNRVLISDLKEISKKYGRERRTRIEEKAEAKTFSKRDLIAVEEVYIALSRDGYIKRSSVKSYKSTDGLPGLKEGDALLYSGRAKTTDYFVLFTSTGYFVSIPVYEIQEGKWKDEGKHVNYLTSFKSEDKMIRAFVVSSYRDDLYFVAVTSRGQIKRTNLSTFALARYSKPQTFMRLLGDDEVVDVALTNGGSYVWLADDQAQGLVFSERDITLTGLKSGGVKSMGSMKNKKIVALLTYQELKGKIVLISTKASIRIFDVSNSPISNRLGKAFTIYNFFKSDTQPLFAAFKLPKGVEQLKVKTLLTDKSYFEFDIDDFHLTPMDRFAKSSFTLPHRAKFDVLFKEGDDYIDDSIEAYVPEVVEEEPIESEGETFTEEPVESIEPQEDFVETEPADDAEQLSLFEEEKEEVVEPVEPIIEKKEPKKEGPKKEEEEDSYQSISIFDDDLDL